MWIEVMNDTFRVLQKRKCYENTHFQCFREISPKSIISVDEEIELMIDASEVSQKGFTMPKTIIDLKDF